MITPPGAANLPLRERKRLQTYLALQNAAQRLVAEHGLDAVSVEQIAAAADVSPRTFFNYFDSKHAAVVDSIPGAVAALAHALAARPIDEPPLLAYHRALIGLLPHGAERLRRLKALVHDNPALEGRYRTATSIFEQVVTEWVAGRCGLDPDDRYPHLFSVVATAGMSVTVDRWDPETGEAGLLTLLGEIFDDLCDGLPAPRCRVDVR